jgi:hypothetical protein
LEIPSQDSVDFPLSEVEYLAARLSDQEVVYIRVILRDFGVTQTQPTLVYEDNLVCIDMSVNPVHRKYSTDYSRHIDIRRHYIRELCLGNLVKVARNDIKHHVVFQSVRQEALEKAGHCSPKWTVLRSLQKVYGARKIRGCTILDAPPFFESVGREEAADLKCCVFYCHLKTYCGPSSETMQSPE